MSTAEAMSIAEFQSLRNKRPSRFLAPQLDFFFFHFHFFEKICFSMLDYIVQGWIRLSISSLACVAGGRFQPLSYHGFTIIKTD